MQADESGPAGERLALLRRQHLIETADLDAALWRGDPALRVVDIRGFVKTETGPDGSQTALYSGAPEEYAAAHVPGATYIDWTRDIVDLSDPVPAQLAGAEQMGRVLGSAGIGDHQDVVVYDAHPASQFATRFWWALRCFGHSRVRVLNGGWGKWVREGRPTTAELPSYRPEHFTPQPRPEWRISAEEVASLLTDANTVLLDARDEGQYTGQVRRGSRAGHIPGARHLPRERLFRPDGVFRPESELREIVHRAGARPERRTVAYCNGGVAATSVLFVLSLLGYPGLTNYDGSWNEWAERPDLPVE